jgi:hypothetical protein
MVLPEFNHLEDNRIPTHGHYPHTPRHAPDHETFAQSCLKNSCGIQKNLPRKLVYGTLRSRGLGIQDPFWTQLIQHLQVILRQFHRNTPTQMLLHETIELVQLHIGSEINFWELPFEPYGFLAPFGWIKHTWEALSQTSLTLKGPSTAFPKQRKYDCYIMDAFVDKGYDEDTMAKLNECRLFLHATTLADMCNADGKSFDMIAWEGKRSPSRRYTETKWIQTCDPGPRYWDCWRLAVRRTFLHPQQHHLRLMQPLGLWHKETDVTWKWWINPIMQRILCHQEDGSWTRASGRTQDPSRTKDYIQSRLAYQFIQRPDHSSESHSTPTLQIPYDLHGWHRIHCCLPDSRS